MARVVHSSQNFRFESGMQELHSGIDFPRPGLGWLAAPAERSPEFFPAFARVSAAIQTILRERIPSHYFEDVAELREREDGLSDAGVSSQPPVPRKDADRT